MKILIFDSSTLINFAMNGLIELLIKMKKEFSGKFIITKEVKYETIDRPKNNKRFELDALQIKRLLDTKVLEMPDSIGISQAEIDKECKTILHQTNHIFSSQGQWIEIIHFGEASCLALDFIARKKGIQSTIAIDERTTRVLCEKPANLQQIFQEKMHTKIVYAPNEFKCPTTRMVRSAELMYYAYKKNLLDIKDPDLLPALLYSTKFKGCAISEEEIREIEKLR